MAHVRLKAPGAAEPIDVSLDQTPGDGDAYTAKFGKKKIGVQVESTGDGSGLLHISGRVVPYHVVRNDGTLYVWVGGRTYRFEVVERTARRSKGGTAAARRSDLTAPMPGTVLKVLVSAGQKFEAHAPLVVMESMKMEMTLSEPHAGKVKEISCKPGQLVAMGAVLMRFDEKNDGDAAR